MKEKPLHSVSRQLHSVTGKEPLLLKVQNTWIQALAIRNRNSQNCTNTNAVLSDLYCKQLQSERIQTHYFQMRTDDRGREAAPGARHFHLPLLAKPCTSFQGELRVNNRTILYSYGCMPNYLTKSINIVLESKFNHAQVIFPFHKIQKLIMPHDFREMLNAVQSAAQ